MEDVDVDELFDEWDDYETEIIFREQVEDLGEDEDEDESEDNEEEESESDDEDGTLKCSKCKKVYHLRGWLVKHEKSCNGTVGKKAKKRVMTEHQKRVRSVLDGLGYDEYFEEKGVLAIISNLQVLANTPEVVVQLRGATFRKLKEQATTVLQKLTNKDGESQLFFKYLSKEIWTILFQRDNLLRATQRQQHIAQNIHHLRQRQDIKTRWTQLDQKNELLLLQKLITAIFEDISRYRLESISCTYKYSGETANPLSLSSIEKDIVAYIGGYVCRKIKYRLSRYQQFNVSSKNPVVQKRLVMFKTINIALCKLLPDGLKEQSNSLSFQDLLTTSLSRGGMQHIDLNTFSFFCYLELSIRPFLSLSRFRNSDRGSDVELVKQLIENSNLLLNNWPYTSLLSSESSNTLLKLFCNLYFRIRKWAYLKVYKEQRKLKETLSQLNTATGSKQDLHGKDSIRKALMSQ